MAAITEAKFKLLHMLTIDATTSPTTTDFAEWIAWADSKIKAYLQCGDTLPTDVGNILQTVADDLLIRKWHYEKITKTNNPIDILGLHVHSVRSAIDLTTENKQMLDQLKGQTSGGEVCAFNFDLDTTEGGFD